MNETPSVPIPQSEHLNAANPFDDSSNQRSPASVSGPITSPAPGGQRAMGQNPPTPGTPNPILMSPPPQGGVISGIDPSMSGMPPGGAVMTNQNPNFPAGGPTPHPGMPGPPQNFPQMNGQWPPQMMPGYRPPPMMHGQRMPDMNRMPGMPPSGQFPGFPGGPMGSMPGYPRPYPGGQDASRVPPNSGPGPGGHLGMNGPSSGPKQFEPKLEAADETLVPNEILDLFPNEPSVENNTPKNEPVQCGMCLKQIYPNQEFEELVRCYSCSKWFKRTCVGINEVAYKQLVTEQNHCAWCCDNCITSKAIQSIMPKHDNNNQCTNQPLIAQQIQEKAEPKERKKRKNAKANGKAKATPAAMPPPMGGMERGMRPGMSQMGMIGNPAAMMNPRMMGPMGRMPHMMTPHGPMGNMGPMGMMGNRGPMMGPGGPMGIGGPGMPPGGQFNPMGSQQSPAGPGNPNSMPPMNSDMIPVSSAAAPGVPPRVTTPSNWPMVNGNPQQQFNHQQFNQQPPPTTMSDFNPTSFGDVTLPSGFNPNPAGVVPGSAPPALPDLDSSNLDSLEIPSDISNSNGTSTPSAMDINNILGNLTSDAPPSGPTPDNNPMGSSSAQPPANTDTQNQQENQHKPTTELETEETKVPTLSDASSTTAQALAPPSIPSDQPVGDKPSEPPVTPIGVTAPPSESATDSVPNQVDNPTNEATETE